MGAASTSHLGFVALSRLRTVWGGLVLQATVSAAILFAVLLQLFGDSVERPIVVTSLTTTVFNVSMD